MKTTVDIPLILLCAVLMSAPPVRGAEGLPLLNSLMEALDERGLIPEGDTAESAAIRGLLTEIDPGSRLLAENEREAFEQELEEARGRKPTLKRSAEWPEGICYLQLNGLYDDGASNVVQKIKSWGRDYKSGVILDLRDAGGHHLDAVQELMQLYSAERTELYEVVSHTNVVPVHAITNIGIRIPSVVLINAKTSHASEALAAVLKAQSATLLIGSATAGDDRLREVLELDDTRSLYIGTRWIRMPDGSRYGETGVPPDISLTGAIDRDVRRVDVELEKHGDAVIEEARRDRELMLKVRHDEALERAADFLLSLKAVAGG